MKILGFIAVLIGACMLLGGVMMDTTVATDSGMRVNNLGLMDMRSDLLIIGIAVLGIGIFLMVAGRKSAATPAPNQPQMPSSAYSADDIKDLQALVAGRGTSGISLGADDPKTIRSVAAGYPAADAGVLPGDRLVMIDGQLVTGDLRENVLRLTGEKGSSMALSIRRGEALHEFTVQRI